MIITGNLIVGMSALIKRTESSIMESVTEGNMTRSNPDISVTVTLPPMAPNYDNPYDSMVGTIHGVNISFTILSVLIVALRIYSRIVCVGRLGIDDYIIVVAAVCIVLEE